MATTMRERIACIATIAALVVGSSALYYLGFGLPPVIIIGGPGLLSVIFRYRTYLQRATDPAIIVPLFLIIAAGFAFHLVEEYLGHYAPAISRLFNIGWTNRGFVIVCFLLLGASGTFVADMPNHYWRTTGSHYFPGMYTVVLAIPPALYAPYRVWQARPSFTDGLDDHGAGSHSVYSSTWLGAMPITTQWRLANEFAPRIHLSLATTRNGQKR